MEQLVKFPTHIKGNRLDQVRTSPRERMSDVQEVEQLGSSDHLIIVTRMSMAQTEEEEREPPPSTGDEWTDWDWMKEELKNQGWWR
jgi:hypothetical protein